MTWFPLMRATQWSTTIAPPAAGSAWGAAVPVELSPAITYVDTVVSFGFSVDVPRHVPAAQIWVQCANTESVPSAIAVPVHVPAMSASVSTAGAATAESAGGVSPFAHANKTNGTARISL